MRNVSDKSCRDHKIHVLCSKSPPSSENRADYEIMCKKCCEDMEATNDNIHVIQDRKGGDLSAG